MLPLAAVLLLAAVVLLAELLLLAGLPLESKRKEKRRHRGNLGRCARCPCGHEGCPPRQGGSSPSFEPAPPPQNALLEKRSSRELGKSQQGDLYHASVATSWCLPL